MSFTLTPEMYMLTCSLCRIMESSTGIDNTELLSNSNGLATVEPHDKPSSIEKNSHNISVTHDQVVNVKEVNGAQSLENGAQLLENGAHIPDESMLHNNEIAINSSDLVAPIGGLHDNDETSLGVSNLSDQIENTDQSGIHISSDKRSTNYFSNDADFAQSSDTGNETTHDRRDDLMSGINNKEYVCNESKESTESTDNNVVSENDNETDNLIADIDNHLEDSKNIMKHNTAIERGDAIIEKYNENSEIDGETMTNNNENNSKTITNNAEITTEDKSEAMDIEKTIEKNNQVLHEHEEKDNDNVCLQVSGERVGVTNVYNIPEIKKSLNSETHEKRDEAPDKSTHVIEKNEHYMDTLVVTDTKSVSVKLPEVNDLTVRLDSKKTSCQKEQIKDPNDTTISVSTDEQQVISVGGGTSCMNLNNVECNVNTNNVESNIQQETVVKSGVDNTNNINEDFNGQETTLNNTNTETINDPMVIGDNESSYEAKQAKDITPGNTEKDKVEAVTVNDIVMLSGESDDDSTICSKSPECIILGDNDKDNDKATEEMSRSNSTSPVHIKTSSKDPTGMWV